jgi:NAD(P)H-dependent FMN reductase
VDEHPLRVGVVVGSTREGRVGHLVAGWIAARARRRDDLAVGVIDLADFAFPAAYPQVPTAAMAAFTGLLAVSDAFVVVTPEYNRSFPASLKQAIDYGYDEWRAKPVAFVSYGCGSVGLYAVEHLRSVFTELHVVTMRDGVGFNLMAGEPFETDRSAAAAAAMLDQLTWWGLALRDARSSRPYVA